MLISTDIVSINQVNRFNRFSFVSRWRLKVESVDLVELKRIDPYLIYHGTWYGTCDYVTPNRGYLEPTNQITDASLKLYLPKRFL